MNHPPLPAPDAIGREADPVPRRRGVDHRWRMAGLAMLAIGCFAAGLAADARFHLAGARQRLLLALAIGAYSVLMRGASLCDGPKAGPDEEDRNTIGPSFSGARRRIP